MKRSMVQSFVWNKDDEGNMSYAGADEYNSLLDRFKYLDSQTDVLKSNSLYQTRRQHLAEIEECLSMDEEVTTKGLENRLYVFRKRIQTILNQLDRLSTDEFLDPKGYIEIKRDEVKAFQDLFSSKPFRASVEEIDQVVVDPARLSVDKVRSLGLGHLLPNKATKLDLANVYDKLPAELVRLFEAAEKIDNRNFRLFLLKSGLMVGTYNPNSENDKKSFFVTDLLHSYLRILEIGKRYRNDDIQDLEDLGVELEKIRKHIAGQMKDMQQRIPFVMYSEQLLAIQKRFEKVINKYKKRVWEDLPKVKRIKDSLGRNNPSSRMARIAMLNFEIDSRLAEIKDISRYLSVDLDILNSLLNQQFDQVTDLYESMLKYADQFLLLSNRPLRNVEIESVRTKLIAHKDSLKELKHRPFNLVGSAISANIDEILSKMDNAEIQNRTAYSNYSEEVLNIFLLCKMDDFLKFCARVKAELARDLTREDVVRIADEINRLKYKMSQKPVAKKQRSTLPGFSEIYDEMWDCIKDLRSATEVLLKADEFDEDATESYTQEAKSSLETYWSVVKYLEALNP